MRHSQPSSHHWSLYLTALAVAVATVLGLGGGQVAARGADAGGQVAGMVVSGLGQSESPGAAMARLHTDGVNTVSLFVWWWTDGPTSTTIRPYDGTESDATLTSQISAARANGERVILTPVIYCAACEGQFRGVMNPTDLPTFYASYRTFIDHYAQLAQQDGVWLLFAGSEMTLLEGQTSQWEAVLSSTRQYFSGLVGYEQNWDVVAHPQFLSDVDVVGVSAYFPLDDASNPSTEQLVSDWSNSRASAYSGRNWVGDLIHLANATGKPILFGEAGYMATDYAARQPFLNAFYSSNPQLQANLYQALLQTFSSYPWWMGVAWWEWSDSPSDAQRTPLGQPAEQLLSRWYAQGWRPGPTGPTGVGTPNPTGGTSATGTGAVGAGTSGSTGQGAAPAGSSGGLPLGGAPTAGTDGGGSSSAVGATGAGPTGPNAGPASGAGSGLAGTAPSGSAPATQAGPGPTSPATIAPGAPLALADPSTLAVSSAPPAKRDAAFDAMAVVAALLLVPLWSTALRLLAGTSVLSEARGRRRAAVRRAALGPPRRGPRLGYTMPGRASAAPASVITTTLPTARR